MKKMAAAEDDWAQFMKEIHSDLSKLPEQDFANASLAKELVEIQTELKMSEDALLKKCADIAVPLEQLGYERAEELTTNMEKWLADPANATSGARRNRFRTRTRRPRWPSCPASCRTSSASCRSRRRTCSTRWRTFPAAPIDSLDKGAGWDAADGPIPNRRAQGVTGNRLPTTAEMGGRSGEGRQGKSSGEFVGEEAVGKGGRKTPSRLTNDAITKGQIKDHSKDPVGGATGGGKESGQGGQGLQGPVPGQRRQARPPTARRQAGQPPQQGRIARSAVPGQPFPSHRPEEDDRHDVAGRARPEGGPAANACASAASWPRAWATSSNASPASSRSARTRPRTSPRTCRSRSSAACRIHRPRGGTN